MPLLGLPNELLMNIAECLESEHDMNAFAQTCRPLYYSVNDCLYRYNMRVGDGKALLKAAELGLQAIVQKALQAMGPKGARETRLYDMALIDAVESNHHGIVNFLLDKGANVNATGDGGVLHCAAWVKYENSEMIGLLLDRGAGSDSSRDLQDALQVTTMLGKTQSVITLMKYGADIHINHIISHIRGNCMALLVDLALWNSKYETAMVLVEKGAPLIGKEATNGVGLIQCARDGQEEFLEMLLKRAAYPKEIKDMALSEASKHGHKSTVRLLLRKGVNVNGGYGIALCQALEHGHFEIAHLLLEHGADPRMALPEAGKERKMKAVKMLIEGETRIRVGEYTYPWGVVKKQYEYGRYSKEVMELLVDNGIDVNAKNLVYDSLLQRAIVDRGCQGVPSGRDSEKVDDSTPFIHKLLEKGIDVNRFGECYGTPLSAAAWADDLDMVKLLLDKYGAKANMYYEPMPYTPLQRALQNGSEQMVMLLLENGADINLNHEKNELVVRYAPEKSRERMRSIVNQHAVHKLGVMSYEESD